MLMSVGCVGTPSSARSLRKMRIGRVVVDDEPRVHRYRPGVRRDDVMRVGVAPESRRRLEERHVETALEQVCRGEPGDP